MSLTDKLAIFQLCCLPAVPLGFPDGSAREESACCAGDSGDTGSIPGLGRSPGGGKWQPTPVFLPGKFHGQRSLAGYIVHGITELNMVERLTLSFFILILNISKNIPIHEN